MTAGQLLFVAAFVISCLAILVGYVVMMSAVDRWLWSRKQRRVAERQHRAEMARIAEQTTTSVARIQAAFVVAQQHLRDEAARR